MSPMQQSNKQTDPENVFVEKERQIQETQMAMGNVESVSNISAFLTEIDGKKILVKKFHHRPVN